MDPVTRAVHRAQRWAPNWVEVPSPPLSVQLLIVVGCVGVCAWIVADVGMPSGRSTTTKTAHVAMLLLFGVCIVAGTLLS